MPPTRESIQLLCKAMNLKITPTKSIDAVLYCRGPKMEEAPPANFQMIDLVKWFLINLKTMHHDDIKKADVNWVKKTKMRKE